MTKVAKKRIEIPRLCSMCSLSCARDVIALVAEANAEIDRLSRITEKAQRPKTVKKARG